MDQTIVQQQNSIKDVLSTYQHQMSEGEGKVELIFDDERHHYVAIRVGWVKQKSVYLCLVHLDICDDVIVIQANNTEDEIDEELVERGIPREKICLGVLPPEVREYLSHRKQGHVPLIEMSSDVQPERLSDTPATQYA